MASLDFSSLADSMASKSYTEIADICDELMLQVSFCILGFLCISFDKVLSLYINLSLSLFV